MNRFLTDESGAVTIDWVVMAASLLGISLAMTVIIAGGFSTAAHTMNQGIAYNDIPEDMRVLLAAVSAENAAAAEAGDTTGGETTSGDTTGGDTSSGNTGGSDTGGSDTGSGDTGGSDTGTGDTGSGDTGGSDTGSGDTGGGDTCYWFCGGWGW